MHIRRSRPDDHRAIAHLVGQLGYPSEPTQIAGRLQRINDRDDYADWCAVGPSGVAVGFALGHLVWPIEQDDAVALLAALVVGTSSRGSGVGRQLVRAFDEWARASGAARAVVTSAVSRVDAHQFYERVGFSRTGLRFGKPYS